MLNFHREERNNNNMNSQGKKLQCMLNKANILWETCYSAEFREASLFLLMTKLPFYRSPGPTCH